MAKKNVIKKTPEWIRRTKIAWSFPHLWICFILTLVATIMLILSWYMRNQHPFWSSICANVFAGLVTGLAICLIGGAKQISIARMQSKKEWLQNLAEMLKVYLGDYHQMVKIHFDKFDGTQEIFDFYYDMSIHASNVNVEVHQGAFNKALSFNPDHYCRKVLGYDSTEMSDKFDELHAYVEMIEINCPGSKEISKRFEVVHTELRKLNSSVHSAIRDLEIRLKEMRHSIV